MVPPSTRTLLEDIRKAAQFLLDDTVGETFESFMANQRLQWSVERGFERIGEAAYRIRNSDPATAARLPASAQMIGMRHRIAHGYDDVDYEIVWDTLRHYLPTVLNDVIALLDEGSEPSP